MSADTELVDCPRCGGKSPPGCWLCNQFRFVGIPKGLSVEYALTPLERNRPGWEHQRDQITKMASRWLDEQ